MIEKTDNVTGDRNKEILKETENKETIQEYA
jgi:hypothetical protein